MYEIRQYLKNELKNLKTSTLCFEVLNPDLHFGMYAGQEVQHQNRVYIYRGYKAWVDLAESLMCKMLTPIKKSEHTVAISFSPLNQNRSFHTQKQQIQERYGSDSIFSKINKNEEPAFLDAYLHALEFSELKRMCSKSIRILSLGVNRGLEFELLKHCLPSIKTIEFVGIDYSQSAINEAKKRFENEKNFHFIACDINNLDELNLKTFDCIITIGTLQSSTLEFKPLFMKLVQTYLKKEGCMILGFPNCRWFDGEMMYGSTLKNFKHSELTRLFKDVYFCKKYLQQKKFKVMISGKNYVFLSAKPINIKSNFDKIDSI
jgi:ubiquinone/menaquinone biosynthesis C-methylase UbiE